MPWRLHPDLAAAVTEVDSLQALFRLSTRGRLYRLRMDSAVLSIVLDHAGASTAPELMASFQRLYKRAKLCPVAPIQPEVPLDFDLATYSSHGFMAFANHLASFYDGSITDLDVNSLLTGYFLRVRILLSYARSISRLAVYVSCLLFLLCRNLVYPLMFFVLRNLLCRAVRCLDLALLCQ